LVDGKTKRAAVFVMAGCTSDHEVSATVTAESIDHGQTKVRGPTAGERVDLEETMRKMAQMDFRFPRPAVTKDAPSEVPAGIATPGIVELRESTPYCVAS
jgi:hypothetical protein